MKEAFISKLRLSKDNHAKLKTINSILEEYVADGYTLSLRQLYYQLVSRDIISNNIKEYKKLSELLTKGRMAGVVNWSSIEDRGRQPRLPYWVTGIKDAVNDTVSQYRLNRQDNQENYIEIWIEKDALSPIFERVSQPYHIHLMVNKGYSSCSAMYYAAERFKQYQNGCNPSIRKNVILYFGDHDPSGKDMVRDVEDRLIEFQVENLIVENPALNMTQIRRYKPPENPAKITDPRAKDYIAKYGNHSWELDALQPQILIDITTKALLKYISMDQFNQMLFTERGQRNYLKEWAENLDETDIDLNKYQDE